METASRIFFTFSVLLLSIHLTLAATPVNVGGYHPIKIDEHVKFIAEFAVTELNRQNGTNLELVRVESAESQVVAGTNYKLIISAKVKGGGLIFKYETVVFEGLPQNPTLELKSFKSIRPKVANGETKILGGYSPIKDLKDPNVKLIAKFAVYMHNQQGKNQLELVDILKGESQVVAGTNYKLVISAKGKNDKSTRNYQTVVFEGLPTINPILKLVSFNGLLQPKN